MEGRQPLFLGPCVHGTVSSRVGPLREPWPTRRFPVSLGMDDVTERPCPSCSEPDIEDTWTMRANLELTHRHQASNLLGED